MYGYHDNGLGAGQWLAMAALMLVFTAVVVGVLVVLLRRPAGSHAGPAAPHDDAERILAERFARGEIDEAEYVRRRDTLRQGR
jgi:putative membrane protein